MRTPNLAEENYRKLAEFFPNAVTETVNANGEVVRAIDADVLRQEITTAVVEGKQERYQFTWPDKKKSIILANQPSSKTLRLTREKSVGRDGTVGSIDTENVYIEGDNLDALKILRNTYLGKVKMIYIDPPYNTGSDFIYEDDFSKTTSEYLLESKQYDEDNNRLVQNLETNGRFHTDWLNMIYPRLRIAKDLLSTEGVIFISIDDNELNNLKKICDEIFGISNFIGTFIINSTPNARDYGHIGKMHEYCLFYAKDIRFTTTNMLPDLNKSFKFNDQKGGYNIHPLYNSNEAFHKDNRPNLYYPFYLYLDYPLDNGFYKIGLLKTDNSVEIYPPKSLKNGVQFVWRWGKEKALKYMNEEIIGYETNPGEYRIVQKMRHDEKLIRSILADTKYSSRRGTAEVESLFQGKIFSFPKPSSLIHDFCKVALNEDDLVMDFFSGSATTAHAVLKLNSEDGGKRRFIMVQFPEKCDKKSEAYKAGYKDICEIGEERIRRAGKIINEESPSRAGDLDIGFRVFRVDSSNMENVYYSPNEYKQGQMELFINNIKPDRSSEDLLFQTMLELGIPLSSEVKESEIAGKKVFCVSGSYLIACFDSNVSEEAVKEIAQKQPHYAVFRDNGFAHDSVVANFDQIFEAYSPRTARKVL